MTCACYDFANRGFNNNNYLIMFLSVQYRIYRSFNFISNTILLYVYTGGPFIVTSICILLRGWSWHLTLVKRNKLRPIRCRYAIRLYKPKKQESRLHPPREVVMMMVPSDGPPLLLCYLLLLQLFPLWPLPSFLKLIYYDDFVCLP